MGGKEPITLKDRISGCPEGKISEERNQTSHLPGSHLRSSASQAVKVNN